MRFPNALGVVADKIKAVRFIVGRSGIGMPLSSFSSAIKNADLNENVISDHSLYDIIKPAGIIRQNVCRII